MRILRHKNFIRSYKKRIAPDKKLDNRFKERLTLFLKDPTNSTLRNHQLIGRKRKYRAFSVTGDLRVLYRIVDENTMLLYDIGTHNQVY